MAPGDTIDGSVAMDSLKDWGIVWDKDLNPAQVVIVQNLQLDEASLIAWCNVVIRKVFDTQDYKVPTLLYVDEGMDFFGENGSSRFGDALRKCYRAGRERNLSTIVAIQRPKGVAIQLISETNLAYVFHFDYHEDLKRLWEMGWPRDVKETPPEQSHIFMVKRVGQPLIRYKLALAA